MRGHFRYSWSPCNEGSRSRMLVCSLSRTTCFHSLEFVIDAPTTAARDPFRTTGKIWRKSPPRTTGLPPKGSMALSGLCSDRMSFIVLSNASKQRRLVIGASSHITSDAACISSASIVPLLTAHTAVSVMSNGILNRECAVRPLGNNKEATPDDATARTFFFRAESSYNSVP